MANCTCLNTAPDANGTSAHNYDKEAKAECEKTRRADLATNIFDYAMRYG